MAGNDDDLFSSVLVQFEGRLSEDHQPQVGERVGEVLDQLQITARGLAFLLTRVARVMSHSGQ